MWYVEVGVAELASQYSDSIAGNHGSAEEYPTNSLSSASLGPC